jgi:hypothetical protein
MMSPYHPSSKLRLRVPFKLQVVYGSRKFFMVFSSLLAGFSLYGPIPVRLADHNGYRYLLGPFICPLLGLAVHLLFPLNPYRWLGYSNRSLNRLDERDEGARHLIEITHSAGYRRAAREAALSLAFLLFPLLGGCSLLFRSSLDWSLVSPGFHFGWGGGWLAAWLFIRVRTVSWSLETWWREYGTPAPSRE